MGFQQHSQASIPFASIPKIREHSDNSLAFLPETFASIPKIRKHSGNEVKHSQAFGLGRTHAGVKAEGSLATSLTTDI